MSLAPRTNARTYTTGAKRKSCHSESGKLPAYSRCAGIAPSGAVRRIHVWACRTDCGLLLVIVRFAACPRELRPDRRSRAKVGRRKSQGFRPERCRRDSAFHFEPRQRGAREVGPRVLDALPHRERLREGTMRMLAFTKRLEG